MPDSPSQDTLDALADLFLTGTIAAQAARQGGAESTHASRASAAAEGPSLSAGPGPIRLPPKLRMAQAAHTIIDPAAAPPPPPAALPPAPPATAPRPRPVPTDAQRLAMSQALERAAEHERRRRAAQASEQAAMEPELKTAPTVAVEAVFLGSLPGFGGPWLSQYAHYLAERRGPVLILHVEDHHIDLELAAMPGGPQGSANVAHADPGQAEKPALRLSTDDEAVHDAQARGEGSAGVPRPALVRTINQLVRHPITPVTTILVHIPDPTNPEIVQHALTLPRWTVICGAFDAAVVGAYRLLKQLLEARGNAAAQEAARVARTTRGPAVGLMVMGSDEPRSLATAKKLNAAAASHLAAPVELIGWQKQMTPVSVQSLGRFTPDAASKAAIDALAAAGKFDGSMPPGLWPVVAELLSEFTPPPATEAAPPAPRASGQTAPKLTESNGEQENKAAEHGALRQALETEFPQDEPAALGAAGLPIDNEPNEDLDHPDLEGEAWGWPQPARAPRKRRRTAATPELDLTTFLHDAQGAPLAALLLPARCPHHPHTQLALDHLGHMHLLRQCCGGPAPIGRTERALASAALRSALVDLIEVRTWVRQHWSLLQLSQRQCRFDPAAKPTLHLFTDNGRAAAALASRLGSAVKVHILQSTGGKSPGAWVATELS